MGSERDRAQCDFSEQTQPLFPLLDGCLVGCAPAGEAARVWGLRFFKHCSCGSQGGKVPQDERHAETADECPPVFPRRRVCPGRGAAGNFLQGCALFLVNSLVWFLSDAQS